MPAATSAEQNFRASLGQFRWSQGVTDDSAPPPTSQSQSQGNSTNPFARFYSSISSASSSYVPLRSNSTTNEEEAYFALSRWERLLGFGGCMLGAAACFAIAFFLHLPLLALRPGKFATSISLGSLLVMFGFAVLNGPINHLKHLFTPERLPFSIAYLSSLGLTLYFSLGLRSYIGALIAAIIQVIALLSYIAAYFPGGIQTLRFGGSMALRGAGSLLPI